MKARNERMGSWFGLLVIAWLFVSAISATAGTWLSVNPAPDNIGVMLLLADGTVMCKGSSNAWYKLVSDRLGSYANCSWDTNVAFMHHDRILFAADIVPDGRMFVAGGEHPNTTNSANAEIYDPTANTWTEIDPPVSLFNPGPDIFSDMISMVTSYGAVLMSPDRPDSPGEILLYYPQFDLWEEGPMLTNGIGSQSECGWAMLPDGSIITVDRCSKGTQRYIPSLNQWIPDRATPVSIWNQDPINGNGAGCEVGPMLTLPNGQVFYEAGTGNNVLYTPSGSTNKGTWTATTVLPGNFLASDCPGAVMPNGKVLFMAATNCGNGGCNPPWHFFEYDYTADPSTNLNEVAGPSGYTASGFFIPFMLDLPDGTVLLSGNSSQLFIYQPGGPAPQAAWKPTITSISENADGSYYLVGTGLNGVTEGAAEGDDGQMASDYPIVRLTDGSGDVYYATNYNWSSTTIQTGSTPESTYFKLPTALPSESYSLVVIANGIASDPVTFYGPVWVDFNYKGATQNGTFANPYKMLATGISAVASGGTINIKPGTSSETFTNITKPMQIHSVGGTASVGD